jgi:hypothetical protein
MMWAGSAWAQSATDVAGIIDSYFGTTEASVSGNTITVTGNVSKSASGYLNLEDIGGLVIDWKADLTVTGGSRSNNNTIVNGIELEIGMITFINGEFKLTGGTIQLSDLSNGTVVAISAGGNTTVTVDGGKVKGNRGQGNNDYEVDNGFIVGDGTLVINSGEINFPNSTMLSAMTLTVNDPAVLNGLALVGNGLDFAGISTNNAGIVYGYSAAPPDFGNDELGSTHYVVREGATWDMKDMQFDMTNFPNVDTLKITVKNGGTLNLKNTDFTFKGTFEVEQGGKFDMDDTSSLTIVGGTFTSGGTININGTLTNRDKVINNGTINNYSGNTLDNQGTLTNNGTINNKTTGKITNTGTIASTGTINNTEGGAINNKGTIKSDSSIANVEGNPVQPLDKNPPSSGGGCSVGFGGLAAVIIVGFFAFRKRRA